jgi:hypothetical protein
MKNVFFSFMLFKPFMVDAWPELEPSPLIIFHPVNPVIVSNRLFFSANSAGSNEHSSLCGVARRAKM